MRIRRFALIGACLLLTSGQPQCATPLIQVQTNYGVIIGIIRGNVTLYQDENSSRGMPRIGKVLGNIIINRSDSTVAVERITRILAKQNLTVESLQRQLKTQFDHYEELVQRLGPGSNIPLYARALRLVQAGELEKADALLDEGLPKAVKELEKGYLASASLKQLRWDRPGAMKVLKEAAVRLPESVDVLRALAELYLENIGDPKANAEAELVIGNGVEKLRAYVTDTPADRLQLADLIVQRSIAQHNQLGVKRVQSLRPRLDALAIYERDCTPELAWCFRDYGRAVASIGVLYGQDGQTELAIKLLDDTRKRFLDVAGRLQGQPRRQDDQSQIMNGYVVMSELLARVYGKAGRYSDALDAMKAVDQMVLDIPDRRNMVARLNAAGIEVASLYFTGRTSEAYGLFKEREATARRLDTPDISPSESSALISFYGESAIAWKDAAAEFDPTNVLAIVQRQIDASQKLPAFAVRRDHLISIYTAAFEIFVTRGRYADALRYLLPGELFEERKGGADTERALLLQLTGHVQAASDLYLQLLPQAHGTTAKCDDACVSATINNLALFCRSAVGACTDQEEAIVATVQARQPIHFMPPLTVEWL